MNLFFFLAFPSTRCCYTKSFIFNLHPHFSGLMYFLRDDGDTFTSPHLCLVYNFLFCFCFWYFLKRSQRFLLKWIPEKTFRLLLWDEKAFYWLLPSFLFVSRPFHSKVIIDAIIRENILNFSSISSFYPLARQQIELSSGEIEY